jgi:valyl-tRNA synthetase
VLADLEQGGWLVKTEAYTHNAGVCYRCGNNVEPIVSPQWFVKMKLWLSLPLQRLKRAGLSLCPSAFQRYI